ncbi:hypothetical protein Vadar_009647 [Vaccinium darrowii]|uniref:Uncharacterized protein n=1 Tax=Vaccinium darrowii TaxID=229202 RepID=A0ACB7WZC0_9ERIC|nr:hypothetical protein Vadar_009647 [Vaccinium darrowii]
MFWALIVDGSVSFFSSLYFINDINTPKNRYQVLWHYISWLMSLSEMNVGDRRPFFMETVKADDNAKLGKGPSKPAPKFIGNLIAFLLNLIGPKGLEFARYSLDYHTIRNYLYTTRTWGKERADKHMPSYAKKLSTFINVFPPTTLHQSQSSPNSFSDEDGRDRLSVMAPSQKKSRKNVRDPTWDHCERAATEVDSDGVHNTRSPRTTLACECCALLKYRRKGMKGIKLFPPSDKVGSGWLHLTTALTGPGIVSLGWLWTSLNGDKCRALNSCIRA